MARANSLEEYRALASASKGTPSRIKRRVVHPLVPSEHDEQVALFQWAERMAATSYPQLRWLFAIPNAGAGAQSGQAGKLKAEGVKPGVPDICLPVPMHGFHGLFLEMKAIGGQASPEQREWVTELFRAGYYATIAYGFAEARDKILNYLRGDAGGSA